MRSLSFYALSFMPGLFMGPKNRNSGTYGTRFFNSLSKSHPLYQQLCLWLRCFPDYRTGDEDASLSAETGAYALPRSFWNNFVEVFAELLGCNWLIPQHMSGSRNGRADGR